MAYFTYITDNTIVTNCGMVVYFCTITDCGLSINLSMTVYFGVSINICFFRNDYCHFYAVHVVENLGQLISLFFCFGCVALLHDVVEDTDLTAEDLRNEGFPEKVLHAVELLTHKDDTDYFDYVRAIRSDPLAVKVKLADLSHNSDLSRLSKISERDMERIAKYEKARQILTRD